MDSAEQSALASSEVTGHPSQELPTPVSDEGGQGWLLKELSPKHKQVCSMLAQGIQRQTIAHVCGFTPEYISMLARQPLVKQYIADICATADIQLEAMYAQSVEAIGEALVGGNHKEKLQAARLQMEATRRIGANSGLTPSDVNPNERLVNLADRLLGLLESKRNIVDARRNEDGTYEIPAQGEDGSAAEG